jgi:hypothetical protein
MLVFAGANYTANQYAQSVDSPSMGAMTFAARVYITAYGASGGTVMVKDPVGAYLTNLEVLHDGTLYGTAGDKDFGGMGVTAVAAPGSGYANGDTGIGTGGDPDIADNQAHYTVNTSSGGLVLTVGITGPGQGYAAGQTYPTTKITGSGTGLTLLPSTIVNQINAISQSVETIPLNTWTLVAMTWDSAGDGLVHLYINGVETTYQGQRTASVNADTSTGPWFLGGDGSSFVFDGAKLAEAVVYATALSSGQIAALAASTTGATGSPLAYWHMCSAAPLADAVGSNTLTLSIPPPAVVAGSSPGYTCTTPAPNVHFTRLGRTPTGNVTFTRLGELLGEL